MALVHVAEDDGRDDVSHRRSGAAGGVQYDGQDTPLECSHPGWRASDSSDHPNPSARDPRPADMGRASGLRGRGRGACVKMAVGGAKHW